jgi:hypothetical protein
MMRKKMMTVGSYRVIFFQFSAPLFEDWNRDDGIRNLQSIRGTMHFGSTIGKRDRD